MSAAQGTQEWLQERCGFATASRANDILTTIKSGGYGAGRKNYAAELVIERLTGVPIPDVFVSDPMKRGAEREPYARNWYCLHTGVLVVQEGFCKHPTIPWVGCSIDSEVEEGVGGLEIKAPNTATHFEALIAGSIPSKNVAQVQFQMWVKGWQWVDFVSYDDRTPENLHGFLVRVPRDQKFIDNLEVEVKKFLAEVEAMVVKLKAYRAH
jgi:YqaJ-like viral recombinase domain